MAAIDDAYTDCTSSFSDLTAAISILTASTDRIASGVSGLEDGYVLMEACVDSNSGTICELKQDIEESQEHSDSISNVLEDDGDGGDELVEPDTSYDQGNGISFHIEKLKKALLDVQTDEQKKISRLRKKIAYLKIKKLSAEKRKEYLENNMPEDETISAWCADLTEDLAGEVGTVEIPGESVDIQVQPGYDGNAAYNQDRDGQLLPTVVNTPAQAFYNLAMMPGWQKWKPTYRYATIDSIGAYTANITLESATSTQQGLNINIESSFTDVLIEYMSCNASAFEVGDSVLVQFVGQDKEIPKIIGFKDNPQPCESCIVRISIKNKSEGIERYYLWDVLENVEVHTRNNDGEIISNPTFEQTRNYLNNILGLNRPVDENFHAKTETNDYWGNRDYHQEYGGSRTYCASLNNVLPFTRTSYVCDIEGGEYENSFTGSSAEWSAVIHNYHGIGRNIYSQGNLASCFTFHQTEDRGYEWIDFNGDIVVGVMTWINKSHTIHAPFGIIEVGAGSDYYSCEIHCTRDSAGAPFEGQYKSIHDLSPRVPNVVSMCGENSFLSLFFMPVNEYAAKTDYTTIVDSEFVTTVSLNKYSYVVVVGAGYYDNPVTPLCDLSLQEIVAEGSNTAIEDFIKNRFLEISDSILLNLDCDLWI